jgi:hypothetical protein
MIKARNLHFYLIKRIHCGGVQARGKGGCGEKGRFSVKAETPEI